MMLAAAIAAIEEKAVRIGADDTPGEAESFDMIKDAGQHLIYVMGEALVLLADGALYWPAKSTLIVADLHLEKGTAYAKRGLFLPPYDTAVTLAALAVHIARLNPRLVIALGDSFHDREAFDRVSQDAIRTLSIFQKERDWVWITGNHDPEIPGLFGGMVLEELPMTNLTFRHEPTAGPARGEVCGHLHPAARIVQRGRSIRRRCFATDGERLILPAYGRYTGGLNVLDRAFSDLFNDEKFEAHLLGDDRLYRIPRRGLAG